MPDPWHATIKITGLGERMGIYFELPSVPVELAIELNRDTRENVNFGENALAELTSSSKLVSYRDFILGNAHELASGDKILERKLLSFGCTILALVDRGITYKKINDFYDQTTLEKPFGD